MGEVTMDKKVLITQGLIYSIISAFINWGIFVTFPQMVAYAASKEDISKIETQLQRIEEKIDKLMIGY